ncbi:histidine phosphatase family protein [uncultured Bartonella sp.]|uniref:SixA phosphatase family protein n=1 Tax=uncultured Bartonella sp. TaxID=104108 RepID=UPI0025F42DE8|nr:histidine phosphatase family protein [uncultured Bartonella sp.]
MTDHQRITLGLMRHGEAETGTKPGKDIDRLLSEKGRFDAKTIGTILAGYISGPLTIICSPAQRTRQTLDALCVKSSISLKIIDKLYYGNFDDYISLITTSSQDGVPLLVIGHNPAISQVVTKLNNNCLPVASLPRFLQPADLALFDFPIAKNRISISKGNFIALLKP